MIVSRAIKRAMEKQFGSRPAVPVRSQYEMMVHSLEMMYAKNYIYANNGIIVSVENLNSLWTVIKYLSVKEL